MIMFVVWFIVGCALVIVPALLMVRWCGRRRPRVWETAGDWQVLTYPAEECQAPSCGVLVGGDDLHLVVAVQDDSLLATEGLAVVGGGTAMSAVFCGEHCPGGCRNPHHA